MTVDPFRPNLIGTLVQCNLAPSASGDSSNQPPASLHLPLASFTSSAPGMAYGSGSTAQRYLELMSAASVAAGTLVPGGGGAGAAPAAGLPPQNPSLGRGILIQVHNVTSSVNMGVRLDLKEIALRCRNTEFNPTRFSACIMRLREPKSTALMFTTGKCVVTGSRSAHNSHLAARKFGYILSKVGFPVKSLDFKIQNIVAATDVGFPIRLEGLALSHAKFASYEPELFPGLIYRMLEPKVVLLLFVSGKVVITGGKSEADLARAMERIHPVLEEFRKVVGPQAAPRQPGGPPGQMLIRPAPVHEVAGSKALVQAGRRAVGATGDSAGKGAAGGGGDAGGREDEERNTAEE